MPLFSRAGLQAKTKSKIKNQDLWVARNSDAREAALIVLAGEAAKELHLETKPQLVLFKSEWPEAIRVNKNYLAVSTGLADITTPEQMKSMMVQQLEGQKHATGRILTKWVGDPALILGGFLGGQQLAAMKWKKLDVRNAFKDPEFTTKLAYVLAAVKLTVWEGLERWRERRHEIKQDATAAKLEGTETVAGALKVIEHREEELKQAHEPLKFTKRLPQFLQTKPSIETRIAALAKRAPEDFASRTTDSKSASYSGKGG
jgi:Zn-dependent protease with chaperone function